MEYAAAIEERYGLTLPALYVEMTAGLCFDEYAEAYLQFTDLRWLTAEEIAGWVFDAHLIDGLIPFAETLGGDMWAWHPTIDAAQPQAVVYIPDEDEVAVVYAPDFPTAIYRMMLDELAQTFAVERSTLLSAELGLQHCAQTLSAYLPAAWSARLTACAQRPLRVTQSHFYGTIGEEELADILEADISYARLDEEFSCAQDA